MARLTIYKDNYIESTAVSDYFIDNYMKDANDAQLKVYLYLLRMIHANMAFSVSDIADKFNHTEKDVLRALRYWEKQKLLSLDYDEDKNLVGIHLCELNPVKTGTPSVSSRGDSADAVALRPQEPMTIPDIRPSATDVTTVSDAGPAVNSPTAMHKEPEPEQEQEPDPYAKPTYSADQLRNFKEQENTAQLLFVAQVYVGRPLTSSDMRTILYLSDVLHFSDDLIDYLIQYCVDRGKKISAIWKRWPSAGPSRGSLTPSRHKRPPSNTISLSMPS